MEQVAFENYMYYYWVLELKGDAEKTDTGYESVMKFIYQVQWLSNSLQ